MFSSTCFFMSYAYVLISIQTMICKPSILCCWLFPPSFLNICRWSWCWRTCLTRWPRTWCRSTLRSLRSATESCGVATRCFWTRRTPPPTSLMRRLLCCAGATSPSPTSRPVLVSYYYIGLCCEYFCMLCLIVLWPWSITIWYNEPEYTFVVVDTLFAEPFILLHL